METKNCIAGIYLLFNKEMEISIYKMNLEMWDPNCLRDSIWESKVS